MTSRDAWRAELESLPTGDWPDYLIAHSGLPGPRGNLELAAAFADLTGEGRVDLDVVQSMARSDDEYLTFCAALVLGERAADPRLLDQLRTLARDSRWRVREGVATGLQRLGDRDPIRLRSIVLDWVASMDPLVIRAAMAAICEPRLLSTPERAAVAVEVCRRATSWLTDLPQDHRRDPDVRTLRKALGYGWSVAIAADPVPGVAAFADLDVGDADVAWIVRENRKKRRLARLLD